MIAWRSAPPTKVAIRIDRSSMRGITLRGVVYRPTSLDLGNCPALSMWLGRFLGAVWLLAENVSDRRFQDFVATGANAGDGWAYDDVRNDADALCGPFVGIENAESADVGA